MKECLLHKIRFKPEALRSRLFSRYPADETASAVSILKNVDVQQAERVVVAELEIHIPDDTEKDSTVLSTTFLNLTVVNTQDRVFGRGGSFGTIGWGLAVRCGKTYRVLEDVCWR
jgi:hypothetical protein